MKNRWFILTIAIALALFALNNLASALTYDFVGNNAEKWFDEFVNGENTTVNEDAGWALTEKGLTPSDNVATGHQRIGFVADWKDYTVEAKFQFLKFGTYNESHLYVRWQAQTDNYFFRTIKRNNAGTVGPWSIEWLRKIGGTDNEGDITDDTNVIADLKENTIYGLRGKVTGQVVDVDFFNGSKWVPAGSVTYPGTYETGGVGVGRSSCQVAWQYISVNGAGILSDATPVEVLGKSATTWGVIKKGI